MSTTTFAKVGLCSPLFIVNLEDDSYHYRLVTLFFRTHFGSGYPHSPAAKDSTGVHLHLTWDLSKQLFEIDRPKPKNPFEQIPPFTFTMFRREGEGKYAQCDQDDERQNAENRIRIVVYQHCPKIHERFMG